MKFIRKFNKFKFYRIDEGLESGQFLVYHRTRLQDPQIISKGFKPGAGDFYGVAMYTCYEFDDQIRDYDGDGKVDMAQYGQSIVEFRVQNNNKFLILDMTPENNQAKKVWGPNHTLIEQLKQIMGGKFLNFYNNDKELIDGFNEILLKTKYTKPNGQIEELKRDEQGRFLTAPIALKLCKMPGFISLVDGLSFTGDNDGKVLIIYDANLAKPTRYTSDDGKTWQSMAKLDYQFQRVIVDGKEILQCKIIETDKELNQVIDRNLSNLETIDIVNMLKDKNKSMRFFSEINLDNGMNLNTLKRFIKKLAKYPKQILDNIFKRLYELPTNITDLSEIENNLKNYFTTLLYFINELSINSNYGGDLVTKKVKEILQFCDSFSDRLNFSLKFIIYLIEISSFDQYSELFKSLILKNKTLYSSGVVDRYDFDQQLIDMENILKSNKYPDWFKQTLVKKISEAVDNNFSQTIEKDDEVLMGSSNRGPKSRFFHLVSHQIKNGDFSNLNKFCQLLEKDIPSCTFYKPFKLSILYQKKETATLVNVARYSYPYTMIDGFKNWMLPKVIEFSDKLDKKSVGILADFCILFLSKAKAEENGNAQKIISEIVQKTPVYEEIINKLKFLKETGEFKLFGVDDENLKNYSLDLYNDLSKFINIKSEDNQKIK